MTEAEFSQEMGQEKNQDEGQDVLDQISDLLTQLDSANPESMDGPEVERQISETEGQVLTSLVLEIGDLFLKTMEIINNPKPLPNFPVTEEGNNQLRKMILEQRAITTKVRDLIRTMADFQREQGAATFAEKREQLKLVGSTMIHILQEKQKFDATYQS